MKNALVAFAVAGSVFAVAPAADAIRPCDTLDVQCHKVCTLPQTDQGIKNIYWNQC